MPRFKARPLNPKMFSGAGDTGVPKIAKLPLTVPVSPVFSKTRPRRDMSATSAGQDKGKTPVTSRTVTASRLKDVLKTGPDRAKIEGGRTMAANITRTTSPPAQLSSLLTSSSVSGQGGNGRVSEHFSHLPGRLLSSAPTAAPSTNYSSRPGTQPPRSQSNLRRPAGSSRPTLTKPTPFKFATTELQQKRVNAANSNTLTLDDLA